MKPKTLILTVVAVTCGLGASYMTSRLLAERSEEPQPKTSILVAKKGLDQGFIIKDVSETFTVKEIPADMVEPNAYLSSDADQLKGRLLKRALREGDSVRQDDFSAGNEWQMNRLMSEGYRAVGIRVTPESTAAGFASLPHSRVDILSTVRRGTDKESYSQTLLENVLVLAADSQSLPDPQGKPMPASVVVVALKLEDAQKVALAQELGSLRLVLRGFSDSATVSPIKTTADQLQPNSGLKEPVEKTVQKPVEPPKAELIAKSEPALGAKAEPQVKPKVDPKVEVKVETPVGRLHVMRIFDGAKEHVTEYRLIDANPDSPESSVLPQNERAPRGPARPSEDD